jgi:hypothetical protein
VVWGDITRVVGDVYTVGHYQGILPQNAELALDRAVSGLLGASRPAARGDDRLVITQHTRRGTLRGALGDIDYFPWGDPAHRGRTVAVAGMGYPGTFGLTALRRLIRELAVGVSLLPNVQTMCTVLIGSGEGTLTIPEAVRGLVDGLIEAFSDIKPRTGAGDVKPGTDTPDRKRVNKLCIVEMQRGRAEEIHRAVTRAVEHAPGRLALRVAPELVRTDHGAVSNQDALAELLSAAASAAGAADGSATRSGVEALIESMRDDSSRGATARDAELHQRARAALADLRTRGRVRVSWGEAALSGGKVPTRISALEEGGVLRLAAITETATVPERIVSVDPKLIDEIVATINDPDKDPPPNLATFLLRLFLPREFRSELLKDGPFVYDLDRRTAQIHWEMLARDVASGSPDPPLSVQVAVARQLRTTYSPPPGEVRRPEGRLRALIIGDPGDPEKGHNLPGAREEALSVRKILTDRGVDVTALIGASSASRRDLPPDALPATRSEVLNHLMHGRFDILHYCGHGGFVADDPARTAGWLFAGGLLTAREIERLEEVPALIVANACLSGRTSQVLEGERRVEQARSEAGLLPSLADEFFRLGVRNYVGTSWEVSDIGAVAFAKVFYNRLLGDGAAIGEAVLAGRKARSLAPRDARARLPETCGFLKHVVS